MDHFQFDVRGRDLIRESGRVIHQSKGSEAKKLYKFNGLYYHLFSEVKSEGRVVLTERATNIFGPYNEEKQLNHADKQANEPNQGGLVQTAPGDWYWFTHHGTGDWEGRCASLLPVTWIVGWPVLGKLGADGIGSMVWSGKKPVAGTPIVMPQSSDDFHETNLPPQWEWNYQSRADKWSLTGRPGWLRLHAFKPLAPEDLLKAGNTLTQRSLRTATNEAILKLDVAGMADGQRAGLCHFSPPYYSSLGVRQTVAVRTLEFSLRVNINSGPVLIGGSLWLKSTWGLDGRSHFAYSLDRRTYTRFGEACQLRWGSYRGDRIGIYTCNNRADAGQVDIELFRCTYRGSRSRFTAEQIFGAARRKTIPRQMRNCPRPLQRPCSSFPAGEILLPPPASPNVRLR
jgi:beta-xylosidase